MPNLFQLTDGEVTEFKRILAQAGFDAETVRKINANQDVAAAMFATARQHHAFRLIHGRFTPLAEKLESVKNYPGVTEADIAQALEMAQDSGLLARYEAASPKNPFLDAVVTVYRGSVPETLLYARDRMKETFGEDKFYQWEDAYGKNVDGKRVRLYKDVPNHTNCVRIEIVDLAANWNPKDGFVPRDSRNSKSAAFSVIYAAAQNPEWVRQMDGVKVPYALVGGLELNVPGHETWTNLPGVWRAGDGAKFDGDWCAGRYRQDALPSLWE